MIQIQRPEQFTKAAERLQNERMGVRRYEPHLYEVTNKTKGSRYHVRITQLNGRTFGARPGSVTDSTRSSASTASRLSSTSARSGR